MRRLFPLVLFFTLHSQAGEGLVGMAGDLHFSLPFAATNMDEFYESKSYEHRAIGFGGGIGARLGLRVGFLAVGAVGEIMALGSTFEKEDLYVGYTTGDSYTITTRQELGGGFLILKPVDSFYMSFEYYGHARNTLTWSDNYSKNPWKKGDRWRGNGVGFAAVTVLMDVIHIGLMFRYLTYKSVDFDTVNTALPSDRYGVVTERIALTQVGIGF